MKLSQAIRIGAKHTYPTNGCIFTAIPVQMPITISAKFLAEALTAALYATAPVYLKIYEKHGATLQFQVMALHRLVRTYPLLRDNMDLLFLRATILELNLEANPSNIDNRLLVAEAVEKLGY